MVPIIDVVEELPRDPKSRYWKGRPLKKITKIVVHYDAVRVPRGEYDPVERYKAQARYHMARNWNEDGGPAVYGFGLMYHYRKNRARWLLFCYVLAVLYCLNSVAPGDPSPPTTPTPAQVYPCARYSVGEEDIAE
jgi:hypothetical protein